MTFEDEAGLVADLDLSMATGLLASRPLTVRSADVSGY
jgi:hypothetical protein